MSARAGDDLNVESSEPNSSARQPPSAPAVEGDWVEDDDDDMDFQFNPENDEDEETEEEEEEEEEDEDTEYHDAEDGMGGIDIEFMVDQNGDPGEGELAEGEEGAARAQPVTQTAHITLSELLRGQTGLARLLMRHMGAMERGDAEDDDEEDPNAHIYGRLGLRRRRPVTVPLEERYPKIPSDAGIELMNSGTFGSSDTYLEKAKAKQRKLANRLMKRELGLQGGGREKSANASIAQGMIPSSAADTIIHYDDRCYSGQFSDDGNFFFSCAQDFKVRMYDTSNPYKWKYYKTVEYPFGQWTITDASLSPDNKFLAYSSIKSVVCLAPTDPGVDSQPFLLDFYDNDRATNARHAFGGWNRFAIWSIRFSGDGREIVAGTGDSSVYVYDIEARKSILKIPGHNDDVNAVCFGDSSSPHILYSGSDDTTLKVWDRRSMKDGRAAGVFLGHTEGLTYVDSKGDGRYVLSNGKDQTMKLWDLRKMMSSSQADDIDPMDYSTGFDYRRAVFDDSDYQPHPHDCSVVTFRGHSVLRTLIRCHFSPPGSTNSRYVYSGSEDGSVYVYNLDATIAGKVDVQSATDESRPKLASLYDDFYGTGDSMDTWKTCVRDASWHPNAPMIAATSWNGWGLANGTCSVHSWNDGAEDDEAEPRMGIRVDDKLRHDERLYGETPPRRRGARSGLRPRNRGRPVADDDDDDE
ncbi:MAG: Sec61p translocation complex subunit [Chaenotheca gracillima]|nr:MAG: Sec61p translocation complex subunit [Chaenotheca gracillima]